MIKKFLEFSKVWRRYRVMPSIFGLTAMWIAYDVIEVTSRLGDTSGVGAIYGGLGLLLGAIMAAYNATGGK